MKTSEEPADLRVRRTRKWLWDALMAELALHPFEEITVKDICERAMVHRTTFYKHYEDKYALLELGMRQMYEDLIAEKHLPPGAFSAQNPPPYFVRLFEHVAEHQPFYKLMLCGEGVSRFQKMIKGYLVEVVETKMHEVLPINQDLVDPPTMHVHFFAGAVLSLLTWWLENDMPHSPYHMAQYLRERHGSVSSHG